MAFISLLCSSFWQSSIPSTWSLCCGCLQNTTWCFSVSSFSWTLEASPWGKSTTSWMTRELLFVIQVDHMYWGGGMVGVTESAWAMAVANKRTLFLICHRKFYKKFGQQAWLVAAITVTEFLIVVKYDPHTITLPIPFFIMQCWFLGLILIVFWTVWRFFFR